MLRNHNRLRVVEGRAAFLYHAFQVEGLELSSLGSILDASHLDYEML